MSTAEVVPNECMSIQAQTTDNEFIRFKQVIENEMLVKCNELAEKLHNYQDQTDNELKNLRRKINVLESRVREKNIVIYGLDEQEMDNDQLKDMVWNLIDNRCNVKCEKNEIDFVRRMGIMSGKPRPVLAGLITSKIKRLIMVNRRSLFGTPIKIQNDMTLDVRLKRKQLIPRLKYLREIGKYAVLRGDKLVVYESNRFNGYNNGNFARKRTFTQSSMNEKPNIQPSVINADTITIHEKGTPEICEANVEVITIDDGEEEPLNIKKQEL